MQEKRKTRSWNGRENGRIDMEDMNKNASSCDNNTYQDP
jgi:hypothetical protein